MLRGPVYYIWLCQWVCVTWNLCIVNLTSIFLILRAKDRLCSASLGLVAAATNFAVTNLSVRIIPRPAWTHTGESPILVVMPRRGVVMVVASTQRYVTKCATFNWTCALTKWQWITLQVTIKQIIFLMWSLLAMKVFINMPPKSVCFFLYEYVMSSQKSGQAIAWPCTPAPLLFWWGLFIIVETCIFLCPVNWIVWVSGINIMFETSHHHFSCWMVCFLPRQSCSCSHPLHYCCWSPRVNCVRLCLQNFN